MPVRLGVPESVAGVPLARRLAWAVLLRVTLLVAALGVVAVVNFRRGFDVGSETIQIVIATVAVAFALAAVYAAVLRTGKRLQGLVFGQLVLDQAAFTVLVYLTGGASSGATSFYGFSCLLGAFLVGLRGAAVAAVAGMSFYGLLVYGLQMGWLGPPSDQPRSIYAVSGEELTAHIVLNVLVIFVVTLLSGYLAERLESAGGRIVEAEARAESAERLAVLGRLSAALAHEIRNPLGSIAGSVRLLSSSPELSDEDKKLCDIIQREASRLNDLVSDMMDVARPKRPEISVVDAARTAREVVALASKSGRGVSDVAVSCSGPDTLFVRADPGQLRQLVWNLVRNAVQASNAGGTVQVVVSESAGAVVLSVADNGAGIDAEARAHLFDAFFTTRSHGTGIGLAVVKRIADDHGFSIDVESAAGQGATFVVRMGPPAELSEGQSPALPPKSSVAPPA